MTEVLITSSVLIAVIAILRAALRDRIRPGLQYALWGLVLLRLLVPISWFESPVSVANAADPIVRQVQQYSAENTRTVTFPVTMGEIPETGEPNEAVARAHIAPLDIARWVWLGGTVILAVWFLFVNIRLVRKLSRERELYSHADKTPVYVTKTLPSPCLYLGDIYLTEEAAADPERAEYIIAHELTHRRHLDGVWSALRVVCLAVYWFNPLVWLAAMLSRRDCELFCDAATVKRLGEDHRFDYGRTLLDLTAVNIRPRDLICSATTMSGSGKSLKERIARIAQNRKTSALLGVVVILIAAVAVGCTFSGGETEMYFEADPEISDPYATPEPERFEEAIGTHDRDYWAEATTSPDESEGLQEFFAPFLDPVAVEVTINDSYIFPYTPTNITLEEFIYDTAHAPFTIQYFDQPVLASHEADATICITAADGRQLIIWNDAGIFLSENGYLTAEVYGGVSGDSYIVWLYNWATSWQETLSDSSIESRPVSAGEIVQPDNPSHTAASHSAPAEPTPTPVAVEAEPFAPVVTEKETEPFAPASTPAPEARDPSIIPIADTPENLWGENWRDGLTEEQIARLETE